MIIKKKREMGDGQSLLPLAPSLASLPSIALSAEPSATPSGQPGKSEGGELGKKGGEGPETPKPPPVLPEELPDEISSTVKLFEEVYTYTHHHMCIYASDGVDIVVCECVFFCVCVLVGGQGSGQYSRGEDICQDTRRLR